MLTCKKCGHEGVYIGKPCPVCAEIPTISESLKAKLRYDITTAKTQGDYETVAENYRILADAGETDAEREYALLLEKGTGTQRNLNLAMDYFFRAAKKCDSLSAYKYSRLVSRVNDVASVFWLAVSAVLGCNSAYIPLADEYARIGKDNLANYYYYLATLGDSTDAIVKLASRYFYGEGIERSAEYAKWYMEKFKFPPIYALKLAYKLRGVKSKEPPAIICENFNGFVKAIIAQAKKLELEEICIKLYSLLSESGDSDALCEYADIYLKGEITDKNPEEAERILTRAAASGNIKAYIELGLLYRDGVHRKQDLTRAAELFEAAASAGADEAYEFLGDIYHSKDFERRDIAKAYELYERAAKSGIESAARKADMIRAAREGYYYRAGRAEEDYPEEAFKGYNISMLMGHTPAILKVAECYARGIGVELDRHEAFLWYKKAREAKLDDAYFPLGICYSRGIGVAFDFNLATENLSIANRLGDSHAKHELTRLYENKKRHLSSKLYSTAMRLIYGGKYSVAVKYLTLARSFRHPKAIYTLGCLCEFGRGTNPDRTKAYSLYAEAEALGFNDIRSKQKSRILKMLKK